MSGSFGAKGTDVNFFVLSVVWNFVAQFSTDERSMMNELRFDEIGSDRVSEILDCTYSSRRSWVMNCQPTFAEYIEKFPPFKDLGTHVCTIRFFK